MFTQTCALVTCHVSRRTQDTVNIIKASTWLLFLFKNSAQLGILSFRIHDYLLQPAAASRLLRISIHSEAFKYL